MLPHLDTSLVAQIHEAQFEYLRGRMEVMRVVRGDPRATHYYFEAEHVRACVAPGIPNPFFNQVLISGPAERHEIERVLAIFEEFGMTPRFEIGPGAISSELAALLAERGFTHTQSDPILVQDGANVPQHLPREIQIDRVEAADANDDFGNTYIRAWQVEAWLAPTLRSYVNLWSSVPGWTLYLAREGIAPVGVGMLFNNGKAAYLADAATIPEYRRRGVQGALIMERIADARQTSARFAFSRAEFGTVSQRNLERAGLQSRYMVCIWTKMAAA